MTWVPDWSASIGSKPQFHSELSFLMSWKLFNASLGKDAVISITSHTLHVQGVLVDRVSYTYSLMEPGIDLLVLKANLASQYRAMPTIRPIMLPRKVHTSQKIKATSSQGGTQGLHTQDFWRLLTSDIRVDGNTETEWRRAQNSDLHGYIQEYHNGLLGHGVRGRRRFSTETRYFGLGPAEMIVGDLVVVLYGGRFPFVLRPTVDEKYSLVGYAHVSGILKSWMEKRPQLSKRRKHFKLYSRSASSRWKDYTR